MGDAKHLGQFAPALASHAYAESCAPRRCCAGFGSSPSAGQLSARLALLSRASVADSNALDGAAKPIGLLGVGEEVTRRRVVMVSFADDVGGFASVLLHEL